MLTIGVTIDVPEPWQTELRAARVSYGDPLGATIPAHITILGPTEVPQEALEEIGDHLVRAVGSAEPFDVELRGTGTFRPVSPVVFVQVAKGISSCEQLEARVRSGVLSRDTAYGYHPHVTVAQGVDDEALDRAYADLEDFRAAFRVDSVSLAVQGSDEVWRPVRAYLLGRS